MELHIFYLISKQAMQFCVFSTADLCLKFYPAVNWIQYPASVSLALENSLAEIFLTCFFLTVSPANIIKSGNGRGSHHFNNHLKRERSKINIFDGSPFLSSIIFGKQNLALSCMKVMRADD